MVSKVKIQGTIYNIIKGRTKISETNYNILKGIIQYDQVEYIIDLPVYKWAKYSIVQTSGEYKDTKLTFLRHGYGNESTGTDTAYPIIIQEANIINRDTIQQCYCVVDFDSDNRIRANESNRDKTISPPSPYTLWASSYPSVGVAHSFSPRITCTYASGDYVFIKNTFDNYTSSKATSPIYYKRDFIEYVYSSSLNAFPENGINLNCDFWYTKQ